MSLRIRESGPETRLIQKEQKVKNRLSNNQIHELGLFQIFIDRVRELEKLGGLDRLKIQRTWGRGYLITAVEEITEELESGPIYTVYLSVDDSPLRMVVKRASDTIPGPKSFKQTHTLLQHLINLVEGQILKLRKEKLVRSMASPEDWYMS